MCASSLWTPSTPGTRGGSRSTGRYSPCSPTWQRWALPSYLYFSHNHCSQPNFTLTMGVMNSSRKGSFSSEGQLWWMKLMTRPCRAKCCQNGIQNNSVADPDPVGSRIFSWIRNYCSGSSEKWTSLWILDCVYCRTLVWKYKIGRQLIDSSFWLNLRLFFFQIPEQHA